MLASREDIFSAYTQEGFEHAFARHFSIDERVPVRDTLRTMYVMRRLNS
jgi:hypothetical protein